MKNLSNQQENKSQQSHTSTKKKRKENKIK